MFSRRCFYALAACALANGVSHAAEVSLPTGGKVKSVDFERHIMGLVSKVGCNSGSCHGSFQGKNGFRLSLFGYEPAMDFANLTRDSLGRRVNTLKPDESLLLLKATGQTAHDGGMRFGKGRLGVRRVPRVDSRRGGVGSRQRRHQGVAGFAQRLRAALRRQAEATHRDRDVRRRHRRRHHPVLRLQDHRRRDCRRLAAGPAHPAPAGRRRPDGAVPRQREGDSGAGAVAAAAGRVPAGAGGERHRQGGVRQAEADERHPQRPVRRRDVPPPRLHRHARATAAAGRDPRVPRGRGPEEAREGDRQAARRPAARGGVGDQVLGHHRQRHDRPRNPEPDPAEAVADVARLAPQARRG